MSTKPDEDPLNAKRPDGLAPSSRILDEADLAMLLIEEHEVDPPAPQLRDSAMAQLNAKESPKLVLSKGVDLTPEKIAKMFTSLTGREPTEADMVQVRQKLADSNK